MSVEVIKDQIFQFLSSEVPEVMVIKGEWGVGKTYSWKTFINEAKESGNIKLERYSYVSLFGLNSLESFKYTIFQNVVKKELINTEANVDTFKSNSASLVESFARQSIPWFKSAPLIKSLSPAIETIAFLSLENTIICIDDLERKGEGLEIKDIMGLVSLLKEQKKCKVVLLLNDGEEGLEDYTKYREKVVDIELTFSPTPEECAEIAYVDKRRHYPRLKELVTNLDIRNIRILKKIERLINLSIPLIDEFEPEIRDQVISSLVLFSWSDYCSMSNERIPPLKFITSSAIYDLNKQDDENPNEKEWRLLLQEYNYLCTDDLDLVLAEAVKTGFFIENELKEKSAHKNKEIIASKALGSFSKAWELYHHSFNDNGDEVITAIYESFQDNCEYITPLNLNATVTLFKDLGENKKASEIIDLYIEKRKNEVELFNLEENNFFGEIKDTELIDKFNLSYRHSVSIETAKEVLDRIAGKNGWDQSDQTVLANTSIEEYYDLFKSESGRHLSACITTCLKFGHNSEINKRATEALKKIAGENKINELRIKKFGVNL